MTPAEQRAVREIARLHLASIAVAQTVNPASGYIDPLGWQALQVLIDSVKAMPAPPRKEIDAFMAKLPGVLVKP